MYLKGRYYWNKRTLADFETAISYFNQAIAKDPGYALAYSGLAYTYSLLPHYGGGNPSDDLLKANAAARKALELDATLAAPTPFWGGNEISGWDFAAGEAEFKKASALDPDDATAHEWYAMSIGWIGGREKEALAEINRAHQLDPLSLSISNSVGRIHIFARRFDDAIAVCKKLADENATFANAHHCLSDAYWGKHLYPQVFEEWKVESQLYNRKTILEKLPLRNKDFVQGAGRCSP